MAGVSVVLLLESDVDDRNLPDQLDACYEQNIRPCQLTQAHFPNGDNTLRPPFPSVLLDELGQFRQISCCTGRMLVNLACGCGMNSGCAVQICRVSAHYFSSEMLLLCVPGQGSSPYVFAS